MSRDTMTMPPLPPPAHTFYPKRGKFQTFSADQMRAYGEACAAAERERCAKLADEYATWGGSSFADFFLRLAAAIRAQGETP